VHKPVCNFPPKQTVYDVTYARREFLRGNRMTDSEITACTVPFD